MIIHLPYPVPLNRVYRNFHGIMVMSPEAKKWKKYAGLQAMAAGVRKLPGAVAITITLHPRSNKDGTASKIRVDIDSCAKLLLDSLNGIAYMDDAQVEYLVQKLGAPCTDGGLTVELEEM